MVFIRVEWLHDRSDVPVCLLSEVGEDRFEVRKVEVFRSGWMDYADTHHGTGETTLGSAPVPDLDEINADPQFRARGISQVEFERVWGEATSLRG